MITGLKRSLVPLRILTRTDGDLRPSRLLSIACIHISDNHGRCPRETRVRVDAR